MIIVITMLNNVELRANMKIEAYCHHDHRRNHVKYNQVKRRVRGYSCRSGCFDVFRSAFPKNPSENSYIMVLLLYYWSSPDEVLLTKCTNQLFTKESLGKQLYNGATADRLMQKHCRQNVLIRSAAVPKWFSHNGGHKHYKLYKYYKLYHLYKCQKLYWTL